MRARAHARAARHVSGEQNLAEYGGKLLACLRYSARFCLNPIACVDGTPIPRCRHPSLSLDPIEEASYAGAGGGAAGRSAAPERGFFRVGSPLGGPVCVPNAGGGRASAIAEDPPTPAPRRHNGRRKTPSIIGMIGKSVGELQYSRYELPSHLRPALLSQCTCIKSCVAPKLATTPERAPVPRPAATASPVATARACCALKPAYRARLAPSAACVLRVEATAYRARLAP